MQSRAHPQPRERTHNHQSLPKTTRAHPQSSPAHLQPAQGSPVISLFVTLLTQFLHKSYHLTQNVEATVSVPTQDSALSPLANFSVLFLCPPSLPSSLLSTIAMQLRPSSGSQLYQISSAPPLLQPRPFTLRPQNNSPYFHLRPHYGHLRESSPSDDPKKTGLARSSLVTLS